MVSRSEIPKGNKPLFTVWSFKRKRDLKTVAITKYKTRLCIDRNKQINNKNYWDIYYPVITWTAIRILLIYSLLNDWHTKQFDLILVYSQTVTDPNTNIYLDLSRDCHYDGDVVLKLKQNIYEQKQTGRVWSKKLDSALQ